MSFAHAHLIAGLAGLSGLPALGGLGSPPGSPAHLEIEGSLESALKVVEERCFECHAAGNVKGGLRLDEPEGWRKSIELENPAESELLYRLRLPAEAVDAMPPKGDRIAAERTLRLEAWIEDGADLAPIEAFLSRAAAREEDRKRSLAALAHDLGASVSATRAKDHSKKSGGLSVSWSHQPAPPTEAQAQQLQQVAAQLVELSFAGTSVTDSILAALPGLPALERVHLERTAVSGRGVGALLKRAPALRYLNLHSTAVQASLLKDVPELSRVETLVLYETPAAAPSAHPFADLVELQPRRLLAVDRRSGRVVLLREVGLDTYEVLSERSGPLGPDAAPVRWLGGTRSSDTARRKGIDDGHGRVEIQTGPERWLRWDTRSGESTEIPVAAVGAAAPLGAAHGTASQRLSSGHRVLILPPRKAASKGPLPEDDAPRPQIVEKNAAGQIVWTFTDAERFPQGLTCVQVIERTP